MAANAPIMSPVEKSSSAEGTPPANPTANASRPTWALWVKRNMANVLSIFASSSLA